MNNNMMEIVKSRWTALVKQWTFKTFLMMTELEDCDGDNDEWSMTPDEIKKEYGKEISEISVKIDFVEDMLKEAGYNMHELHNEHLTIQHLEAERLKNKQNKNSKKG